MIRFFANERYIEDANKINSFWDIVSYVKEKKFCHRVGCSTCGCMQLREFCATIGRDRLRELLQAVSYEEVYAQSDLVWHDIVEIIDIDFGSSLLWNTELYPEYWYISYKHEMDMERWAKAEEERKRKVITFDIKKEIAVLSKSENGWSKELNSVSYKGAEAKLDLRDWSPDKKITGAGITLTEEEAKVLLDALIKYSEPGDSMSCRSSSYEGKTSRAKAKGFVYEIAEKIVVLSKSEKGWTKELNLVSYNGAGATLDLREWAPDRGTTGTGVTLTEDEAKALMQALGERFK